MGVASGCRAVIDVVMGAGEETKRRGLGGVLRIAVICFCTDSRCTLTDASCWSRAVCSGKAHVQIPEMSKSMAV